MIQFMLASTSDPDMLELRSGTPGSDIASKPPFVIRHDELTATLLVLLHAAQVGVS